MDQGDYLAHLHVIKEFIDTTKKEDINLLFNGKITLDYGTTNEVLKKNMIFVLKNINTILYTYGIIKEYIDNPITVNEDKFMNNTFYLYDILYSILQKISLYLNNTFDHHVYQAMYNIQYQTYYDIKTRYTQNGGVRKGFITALNINLIKTIFEFMKTLNYIIGVQSDDLRNQQKSNLSKFIISIIKQLIYIEVNINTFSQNKHSILIIKPEFRLSYMKTYIIEEVLKRIEWDKRHNETGNKLKEYTKSKLDQMMKEVYDKSVEDANREYPMPEKNISLDDVKFDLFPIEEEKVKEKQKGIKIKLSPQKLIIKGLSNRRSSVSEKYTDINKFISDNNIKHGDVVSYCNYFIEKHNKKIIHTPSRQTSIRL